MRAKSVPGKSPVKLGKQTKREQAFVQLVWDFYADNGRDTLPWRQTTDPYKILVSELMLQQTQVDRVIPKYLTFIKKWPTAKRLAAASLGDVLIAWQGLGYNRRAKFLFETATIITKDHQGLFPSTEAELRSLPGVGPYTAKAILTFAYNQPVVLVETNVRQVFIHHFFSKKEGVTDLEILRYVERTLPAERAKDWYAALMDYGTALKKSNGNNTARAKAYVKQSAFKGSDREVRGAILRSLTTSAKTMKQLERETGFSALRLQTQETALLREGLVVKEGRRIQLPT